MSFFKHIGKKAIKYILHLHVEKIELNLTTPIRMSVQLKRGIVISNRRKH